MRLLFTAQLLATVLVAVPSSYYESITSVDGFTAHPFPTRTVVQRSTVTTTFLGSSGSGNNGDALTSSTSTKQKKSKTTKTDFEASTTVIYQKVLRAPPSLPDMLFLGYLVEYLDSKFDVADLPNLPMIYETKVTSPQPQNEENDEDYDIMDEVDMDRTTTLTSVDNDSDDDENGKARSLVVWDSPLSSCPEATRMEVEVVGIYTDSSSQTTTSAPNMAMVVVRKAKEPKATGKKNTGGIPPMMQALFADSEKKILKALDRGLEDFIAGKIKFDDDPTSVPPPTTISRKTKEEKAATRRRQENSVQDSLEAELLTRVPERITDTKDAEDVVFDTYAVEDTDGVELAGGSSIKNDKPSSSKKKKPTLNKKRHKEQKEAVMATMKGQSDAKVTVNKKEQTKTTTTSNTPQPENYPGFAVQQAKKKAAAQKKTQSKGADTPSKTEDFAVAAARKAKTIPKRNVTAKASSNKSKQKEEQAEQATSMKTGAKQEDPTASTTTPLKKEMRVVDLTEDDGSTGPRFIGGDDDDDEPVSVPASTMPAFDKKKEDYYAEKRAFRTTFSSPKRRQNQREGSALESRDASQTGKSLASRQQGKLKAPTKPLNPTSKKSIGDTKSLKSNSSEQATVLSKETKKSAPPGSHKPELPLSDSSTDATSHNAEGAPSVATADTKKEPPSREQMELDILKAAESVMDEIAEQGEEMSPEDLLRDILKFDEDQKKEEKTGGGFVSGAFDKAKELLKERHTQHVTREQEKGVKYANDQNPDSFPQGVTAEEELKAMFKAGEKIADSRITRVQKPDLELSDTEREAAEREVDELIAQDKSVSNYARVLDDELVELEVAINQSPGEELDSPTERSRPIFDVMSGPETYNPNVEMDTVNYPGAMPGRKDVKLPKELDEAVKQAKFASEVLTNLKSVETEGEDGDVVTQHFLGEKRVSQNRVDTLKKVVQEATQIGLIRNPVQWMEECSRMQMIVDELWEQPDERFRDIAESYRDLLLSENFVDLIKDRMTKMADRDLDALRNDDASLKEPHAREREILTQLVSYAQVLLKEARALGAELEAQQIELVRTICKVAMDPKHASEEETAMALTDTVRDLRPLLDDMFVAYLKHAVAEEEGRLARAGVLDDPEENQWLFVLRIVQQGVYKEVSKSISRYIDHIYYVLRMETPKQRRKFVSNLIDDMPTMDVRPFVQVVENIAGSLGDSVRGEFSVHSGSTELGEMTNKVLQLYQDVKELLPPDRIALKSRDADEWAARQKEKLMEARKVGQQRLKAARETSHLDGQIEDMVGGVGELEQIDPSY